MQIHAGVVYSVFGVTIFIGMVLLVRAIISLRRHLLNYYDEFECPDGDEVRRLSGSADTRLVLSGDTMEGDDVPPPPPRVSLPEWAGGAEEGATKRVPPLSPAQLDKACPALALAQSTLGGGATPRRQHDGGTIGHTPLPLPSRTVTAVTPPTSRFIVSRRRWRPQLLVAAAGAGAAAVEASSDSSGGSSGIADDVSTGSE
ncbi:hypothetical protein MMPV_009127 [Pyropia vietnamensis]